MPFIIKDFQAPHSDSKAETLKIKLILAACTCKSLICTNQSSQPQARLSNVNHKLRLEHPRNCSNWRSPGQIFIAEVKTQSLETTKCLHNKISVFMFFVSSKRPRHGGGSHDQARVPPILQQERQTLLLIIFLLFHPLLRPHALHGLPPLPLP